METDRRFTCENIFKTADFMNTNILPLSLYGPNVYQPPFPPLTNHLPTNLTFCLCIAGMLTTPLWFSCPAIFRAGTVTIPWDTAWIWLGCRVILATGVACLGTVTCPSWPWLDWRVAVATGMVAPLDAGLVTTLMVAGPVVSPAADPDEYYIYTYKYSWTFETPLTENSL